MSHRTKAFVSTLRMIFVAWKLFHGNTLVHRKQVFLGITLALVAFRAWNFVCPPKTSETGPWRQRFVDRVNWFLVVAPIDWPMHLRAFCKLELLDPIPLLVHDFQLHWPQLQLGFQEFQLLQLLNWSHPSLCLLHLMSQPAPAPPPPAPLPCWWRAWRPCHWCTSQPTKDTKGGRSVEGLSTGVKYVYLDSFKLIEFSVCQGKTKWDGWDK